MKSIKTLKKLSGLLMIIVLTFNLIACYNTDSEYDNYEDVELNKVEKLTISNVIDYIENGEDRVNFKTQDITHRKSTTGEENNIITGEIIEAYEFSCRQATIEVYEFKNEDEAQLYMAKYTTDGYSDYQSVYNDLKTKLTGLYGEGENRDIRYSNECTYWVDSEGNELVLSMGSLNSVEVSYAASGHRERLKQMHDIRLSEIYLAESAERAQKANDTSGL